MFSRPNAHYQTSMEHVRLVQGYPYVSNNRRIAGGDTTSAGSIASSPHLDGMGPRRPVLLLPTSSYSSGLSPASAASSCIYSPRRDEVTPLGSQPFFSPSPTTPSYAYSLPTGVQEQRDGLDNRQNLPYNPLPRPDLVVSPIHAFPNTMLLPGVAVNANAHVSEYQRSNREQPTFGSPEEPPFPLDGTESGSAGTQDAAPWFVNHASTSGGGGYRGRPKAMNRPVMADPRVPYSNDLSGSGPYPATGTVPHTSGLPHSEAASYDQYSTARSSYSSTQLPATTSSSRQMEGGNDGSRRPGPPQPHSLSDETEGDGRTLGAGPSNLRSVGIPNKPGGAQYRGRVGRPRKTANPVKGTPSSKATHKIKRREFQAFLAQFAANSAGTRGPTRLVPVPQTRYKCPQKQDWEYTAPVEFGNLKLTDAADQAYPHLQGRDEKVLNYRGAGSSVTCRLSFSGRVIGTSKILTTDNKQPRDFITKKKLAFEVSKFVWEHIEIIQNEPGCANITFQNLMLVRLVRVARASWQPVLCYEVPVSYPNGSG